MGRGLGAEVGEFIGAFVHAMSSVGSHVFEEDVDAAGSEGCKLLHVPRNEGFVLARLPRSGGRAENLMMNLALLLQT